MARCFRIGVRREQDVKEKITLRSSQQAPLKKLIKNVAANSRLSANILLRKTRLANVIKADQFFWGAMLEDGYFASQVVNFLGCHPSNVSRAMQKS